MKNLIYLPLLLLLISCQADLTKAERELIYNAETDTPFRVLQTTNREDSLFLRTESKDIKRIKNNPDLQQLIARLHTTLEAENGVGIAAPQIGIARNVFLFMRIDKPERPVEVVINPKITAYSDEVICFERDGCLSVPDESGNTLRHKWIDVEYYNENGEKIKERLEGHSRFEDFTGIIFQHEYDHLRARLFFDKLCP
ncbi:MAG: peptide deformylase [Bacteroidales bacterium]|nr:peptide deformylase [Bacteroidales bacterium]